ncbi:1-aminocyclopropane-1-carboxylate oxidase [Cytospora mali]|uniref:1-aminocyclopropane-1-carboxylate oxidase n=1 Tax=Cytospora mali TaxID=578113 RepID=A0A194W4U3_CYTMA|nr:1-aminocyclopropane-1-carboxylate oxidase [Valsa mali]
MAASTSTASNGEVETFQLQLSSGNGPVYRTVLRTPLRDATPDEIPIIDVSGIFSTSVEDRLAVARQIHNAAANNGFFYIKNHGIPSTVTGPAHQACLDFFRQDIDTKQKADATKSAYYNGYKAPKTQRINPSEGVDNRETFSWTYDPRCDPAVRDLSSIPEDIRRHIRLEPDGPEGSEDDRFPWCETRSVPHFKASVVRYWRSCLALARQLVRTFALSLGLPEAFFDSKFSHPDAALALNYYPPIAPRPVVPGRSGEDEVSIGSHTDFQLFTMLWQDSNGGLQVLNRQGQWINAKPIEGTFVVNIADYLQRITNDKYISTVHRAVNNSGKERISMPFFFGFNSNESCGVLDSCVGADGVRKYEEISCQDWVKRRVRAMHDTKPGEAEGAK